MIPRPHQVSVDSVIYKDIPHLTVPHFPHEGDMEDVITGHF